MDILKKRLLENGDPCYFYISSVESPYIYLRFNGIVREIHTVTEEQVVYRIEPVNVMENEETIYKYINRNQYRCYDLKYKQNRTKKFYTFDIDPTDFIEERKHGKYYFEVPSAMTFETVEDMEVERNKLYKYITSLLRSTLTDVREIMKL